MDTFERLDQMKLFDVMPDDELARWADKFRREHHARGTVVIREDERATAFYVVDLGELRARTETLGRELPRAYFYPGDYFGETALLTGQPRNATVDVLTDAELLVLDKMDFDQLMEEFPEIREMCLDIARQREEAGRMRFPWQHPKEVTLFFSTKHWIAFVRKLPVVMLMALLGGVLGFFYLSLSASQVSLLVSIMLLFLGGTLLGLSLFFLIYHFLDWRNDHYIITNRRVLHVERVLLLREYRDEAPIDRVQDVQVSQDGILANLLEFGDVVIQTAAATEKVIFSSVPHPDYVYDALFTPWQHTSSEARAEVRESIRQELGRRLNIDVALEDEQETVKDKTSETSTESEEPAPFILLDWARRFRRWLGDLFTFETWIYSDGGNTITWRKNNWLLFTSSLPPFFAAIFVMGVSLFLLARDIDPPTLGLFPLLLLLPVFLWWFYVYWDWQNDIYVVSGNRLIDLKRRPFFLQEERRETTLDRVENIGLSIPGPLAQLLNYGTVVIETAGEVGAFNFKYVHDPRGVQQEIFDRMEKFRQERREAELHRRHAEMAEWFEIYEELKEREEKLSGE